MKRTRIAVLLSALTLPAWAGDLPCPDLSAAVQVAPCPSEEDLRYTFTGSCSNDARVYAGDTDNCVSFEAYRKTKNIALWEAANGEFQGYVSCDLAPAAIKDAKPRKVSVGHAGKITRVACEYGTGITFAHRTRAACKVEGSGDCASGACKAHCD